jgi:hypothetical protein
MTFVHHLIINRRGKQGGDRVRSLELGVRSKEKGIQKYIQKKQLQTPNS